MALTAPICRRTNKHTKHKPKQPRQCITVAVPQNMMDAGAFQAMRASKRQNGEVQVKEEKKIHQNGRTPSSFAPTFAYAKGPELAADMSREFILIAF